MKKMSKPLILSKTMSVLFHFLPYYVILIFCAFTLTSHAFEIESLDLGRQITKVAFNAQSDFIFVGGHNFISVLASDLQVIHKVDVGPVNEEEFCHPFTAPCDNNVTVLEFDVMNDAILVCGTAYQGTCALHDALELNMFRCIDAPFNRTTANRVSASRVGSTVVQILDTVTEKYTSDPRAIGTSAFSCRSIDYGMARFDMLHAKRLRPIRRPRPIRSDGHSTFEINGTHDVSVRDKSSETGEENGREVTDLPPREFGVSFVTRILVASWEKTSESEIEESQPIISLRSLRNSGFAFEMGFPDGQSASNTGIHVKPKLANGFEMDFKHAFTTGNFTYLISLRTKPCDSKNVGNGKCTLTVLSRVNNINSLIAPYIEMPLSCKIRSIEHELLLSFAVGKVSSRADGSYLEILVLIAAFGKEKIPGSQIPDPDYNTAICLFSMDTLDKTFKLVKEMCRGGFPDTGPPYWIKDTGANCANERYEVPKILAESKKSVAHNGHVLAIMPHTPRFRDNHRIALNSKMHVYTADRSGQIHKFSVESEKTHLGYDIKILTSPDIVFNLSPDISSQLPTSAGITDHMRAVTFLAYGTQLVSLSLDFCRQFGTCSTCRKQSQQCRWCSGIHSCLEVNDFQMQCNQEPVESCPPHLADFNPKDVPVSGGSIITLRGMHLGMPDEGHISVKICNQECDYVKPRVNTLECTVKAKCEGCPNKCYIEVEVNQRESNGNTSSRTISQNNQLTYVTPRLTSIIPTYGPISGGVIVTVRGEHLRVGTRSNLDVSGIDCRNIPSTMENDLTCVMERAPTMRNKCGQMTLHIDDHITSSSSVVYCFREDPKISRVEPAATLIDGGLILNVSGSSLDSVSRMQFQVTVSVVDGNATKPEIFTSLCLVIDATKMVCETPNMDRIKEEMDRVEYRPGYLNARMAFLVDNRAEVKMFTSKRFLVYPTPRFVGISEKSKDSYIYPRLKDKLFSIKAQSIPEWLQPSDIKVFVGKTECPVRNITSDTIFCDVRPILRAYRAQLKTTTTTKATPSSTGFTAKSRSPVYTTVSSAPIQTNTSKATTPSSEMTTSRVYNATNATVVSRLLLMTNATTGSDITTTIATIEIFTPRENSSSISSAYNKNFMRLMDGESHKEDDDENAPSAEIRNRRGRLNSKTGDTERGDNNIKKTVRHQLVIQIGNYREIPIGVVQVGPLPDDVINPPEKVIKKAQIDAFLIGGIVGSGVLCILVLSVICAVFVTRKKRRAQKHPYYMNEIGSSHPGSSEVSMPTLTQILESELEPSKKTEINNLIISSDRLILGKAIGSGNFGCVYEGMLAPKGKESPMKVAIKTLQDPVTHSINLREFVKEAIIMVGFQHPHVLGLVGLVETEMGVPYVVLPYMGNGDLLTYVRDPNRTLSLYDVIEFGIDICSGMAYLSSVKLVHRDLAARNCMLDKEYRAKVADFGLCRDIYEKGYYTSDNKKKLPIRWMAVESIERGAYSTKSDVWSMGVVLWELLSRGVTPYPGVDGWDIINYLRKRRLSPPFFCPDELYKLMMTCWAKDPDMRPTFKALQKELCLLTGQDPGSGSTTPVINRSVNTAGQTSTFKPGLSKSLNKSKDDSKNSNPTIQITPGTPREDLAQVEVELTRLKNSNQPSTSDTELGSVMSLPRSQAVENMLITIPACHSSRDITKSAAANYLQLVDNYEPAPKFANPFHRSKKKNSKSDTRKIGSRKERGSSSRSKGGSEKRATPNDYSIPFDGQKARASADMRDSQIHVDSLIAVHRTAGSNYFELETNSQRSSVNSILDGRSSGGSSFMMDPTRSLRGRGHDQLEHETHCSSAAMSYQSMASSEDLTRPDSDTNNYDRLSRENIEGEEGDRHYHLWKEPEVELRENDNGEGYNRLCSEFMDPETSALYPRWQEHEITSRPDSRVANYSRISDMETEPGTSPYYQICEQSEGPDEIQDENLTTSM